MAAIAHLHRTASVAIEHIILMMDDTERCKIRPLENIQQVLVYLNGNHEDEGKPGDRGYIYRKLLAKQIQATCDVQGVSHDDVLSIVNAAIDLQRKTSEALRTKSGDVEIDMTMQPILERLAKSYTRKSRKSARKS
jgi:hypothetical protein